MPYHQLHIVVYGRVQGVGFRAATAAKARGLALCGWVRNCPDGSVEAVAIAAERKMLEEFARWCRQGPPAARVDRVQESWLEVQEMPADFNIRFF